MILGKQVYIAHMKTVFCISVFTYCLFLNMVDCLYA